ncbi:MAG: sigma-54 dependent transcriptional regulator [Candidatus Pacebacteria bacterium]|nr:sigma-54 dependent transcriptional regulator [Candidatus Paceibacterota bacterium]
MKSILVVDDEMSVRASLEAVFEPTYRVLSAESGEQALELAEKEEPDVAIVDLIMPGMSGLELLPELKRIDPTMTAIVLSALSEIPDVVRAMQMGASQYLTKPFDVNEVKLSVEMALRDREKSTEIVSLESQISRWYDPDAVVGSSEVWEKTLNTVRRAAKSPGATVIFYGESGTGKELLSRLTHKQSVRAGGPFVPLHCAAVPETLLESELFGHEKGSFTGATERRHGCVEMADGGTLFMDEIGEMPASMQTKLLRFLQDHRFLRVGGRSYHEADVRVMAATNRDLQEGVREGWFREDLFYRLNVVPITIPPLRERVDDIPLLVDHFLRGFRRERGVKLVDVTAETMDLLRAYEWPGNVRELRNIIERAVVLHGDGTVLLPEHLPAEIGTSKRRKALTPDIISLPVSLEERVKEVEKDLVQRAVNEAGGNVSQAAVLLRTTRRILKYKMDQYGIS